MELNRANARVASKAEQAANLESLLEQQKSKYSKLEDEYTLLQQNKATDQSFSSSDSTHNNQIQQFQLEIENLKQIILSLELSNQELSAMVEEKNTELEGEKDINVWLRELMAKVGERDESNTLLLEEAKGDREQLLTKLNEAIQDCNVKSDELSTLKRENEKLRKQNYSDRSPHKNIDPSEFIEEKYSAFDDADPINASNLLVDGLGASFQGIFNASSDDVSISRLADRLDHVEKRSVFVLFNHFIFIYIIIIVIAN
jgi:chromosome segregation ATPase